MASSTSSSKTAKRSRPARKPRVGETRAVTYRLYPTHRQDRGFDELLMWQRRLYNAALDERRGAWRFDRRSVTKFDQLSPGTSWNTPGTAEIVSPEVPR